MAKAKQGSMWKNRIVGQGQVDPVKLKANPANWREHEDGQREAMRAVFNRVGWVQQVIVNKTTGNLIDGHMRVEEAVKAGEPFVPVIYVELTQDEENFILATYDPLSTLAGRSDANLRALLDNINRDSSTEALLANLGIAPENLEPSGADGDEENESKGTGLGSAPVVQYNIVFDDELQQSKWYEFLKQLKVRYPDAETIGERISLFLDAEVL